MTIKRFSPHASLPGKRILSGTLLLALGLASSPLLAAQTGGPLSGADSTATSHAQNEPVNEVSSSRINGRSDWDIDYPSQLAPQPVRPSGQASAVAGSTQALNISGSAPAPAAD